MYRLRKVTYSNKAPRRVCVCQHEVWIHKGYTQQCLTPKCVCQKMRVESKGQYWARQKDFNGIHCDSGFERDGFRDLKARLDAGLIKGFRTHVPFDIWDPQKERWVVYIADSLVEHLDGSREIIEWKGGASWETSRHKFNLAQKQIPAKFPDIRMSLYFDGRKWRG